MHKLTLPLEFCSFSLGILAHRLCAASPALCSPYVPVSKSCQHLKASPKMIDLTRVTAEAAATGRTDHGGLELQLAESDGGGFLEELCTAQPHLPLLAGEECPGLGFQQTATSCAARPRITTLGSGQGFAGGRCKRPQSSYVQLAGMVGQGALGNGFSTDIGHKRATKQKGFCALDVSVSHQIAEPSPGTRLLPGTPRSGSEGRRQLMPRGMGRPCLVPADEAGRWWIPKTSHTARIHWIRKG